MRFFALIVGSFLLPVELSVYNCVWLFTSSGAFVLTVGVSLLIVGTVLLTVGKCVL